MVQKRPFEVEEAHEISSKLPRQEPCDNLSLFPDINSFEDASHVSGLSAKGGFSEAMLVYEEELPSIERDIEHSPCREDDPDSSLLPGNHSFSSGGTSGTSEEDVWIQAPFKTCFFPEYFYPERPVTRREVIYSLLLECPPQKKVPIGPLHQADIPQSKDADGDINQVDSLSGVEDRDNFEEPLAGTSIIPIPTTALSVDSVAKPEHGITDCSCLYKGSIRCVRQHVMEARDKLKTLLGLQVLEELGFSNMGEQVADKWTKEEESLFHEVVLSNPLSMGRNFWSCLSHSFPSRTKAEIVSYYFNVFMLRKRAEQNRLDPMNADSDNDEWQAIEEDDEDSVVESPFYQLHPVNEGGDNYDECQKENISDETCEDDDRSSPHIGGVDDSQASTLFQPVQKTWNESDRLHHGTQDDSCTSFDIESTVPGMQMKYDGG